jgi:hypothetical protein
VLVGVFKVSSKAYYHCQLRSQLSQGHATQLDGSHLAGSRGTSQNVSLSVRTVAVARARSVFLDLVQTLTGQSQRAPFCRRRR